MGGKALYCPEENFPANREREAEDGEFYVRQHGEKEENRKEKQRTSRLVLQTEIFRVLIDKILRTLQQCHNWECQKMIQEISEAV